MNRAAGCQCNVEKEIHIPRAIVFFDEVVDVTKDPGNRRPHLELVHVLVKVCGEMDRHRVRDESTEDVGRLLREREISSSDRFQLVHGGGVVGQRA